MENTLQIEFKTAFRRRKYQKVELPFTLKDWKHVSTPHCVPSVSAYLIRDVAIISGLCDRSYSRFLVLLAIFWLWRDYVLGIIVSVTTAVTLRSPATNGWIIWLAISAIHRSWYLLTAGASATAPSIKYDTDESWYPVTKAEVWRLDWEVCPLELLLLAYPLYLFKRSPEQVGSHFHPPSVSACGEMGCDY